MPRFDTAWVYPLNGENIRLMKNYIPILLSGCVITLTLNQCINSDTSATTEAVTSKHSQVSFGGFNSQEEWGEPIVIVSACHDCHTPKKMTAEGPVPDSTRWLSGHPAEMTKIEVDKKEIEGKGLIVTKDLTEWAGAWGTTYTANLTPDPTGIGNWTEQQFYTAIREGKYKGLKGSRSLLPPMPWQMYRNMTDNELKAIFAYLKSIRPVRNVVPPPIPPASAMN